MCGLVGVIVKSMSGGMQADVALFSDLLYMDALRGFDSTGVATLHKSGDIYVVKEATEAPVFMKTKEYKDICTEFVKDGKVILGHNRKSTIGKTVDKTAHPFVINEFNDAGEVDNSGRYVFMHNGTLRNHEKLFKTEVDSEALGKLLCPLDGDPRKIEEALGKVDGAYACMWLDQEANKVYLLRNHERPLYVSITSFGYVLASEYGFIAAAQLRNRVELKDCKLIETDTLYSFDLDKYDTPMTTEKLVVKKAPAPHSTKASMGGMSSVTKVAAGDDGEVSKNSFKRIRAGMMGKTMSFWLSDYKARVANDANPLEWLVWGDNDESLEFTHEFRGFVSDMKEEEMLFVCDSVPLWGKINDVTYNRATKGVIFHMENIQLMKPSKALVVDNKVVH